MHFHGLCKVLQGQGQQVQKRLVHNQHGDLSPLDGSPSLGDRHGDLEEERGGQVAQEGEETVRCMAQSVCTNNTLLSTEADSCQRL